MKLSIIIPTLNRFDSLKKCIESVREFSPTVEHETIVIDGGSTDGSKEWLHFQTDLIVLQHNKRTGCIKAFNDGFHIAQGEYCAQLSDDVILRDDSLDVACYTLDNDDTIGQVVIKHLQGGKMQGPQFTTANGNVQFCAFGLTRRWLGDLVGWWGDYYHQQGDVELSIKVYNEGYRVEMLPDEYYVIHEPGESEFRICRPDYKLFKKRWGKWTLPLSLQHTTKPEQLLTLLDKSHIG